MRHFLTLILLISITSTSYATVITFDEAPITTAPGFNGESNPSFLSSDGEFRVEAFWLNNNSHFHIFNAGGADGNAEHNHNQAGGVGQNQMQGIRITRVDGNPFDLISADLFGQVSVGELSDVTTGAGIFTLFSGSGTFADPGNVSFGAGFTGVTSIILGDPASSGGNSSQNSLDNIFLQQSGPAVIPEPTSLVLFGMMTAGVAGYYRLRRKKKLAK